MTTQEIKANLRLKVKNKKAKEVVKIYENNQAKLKAGSDLEEGLILNDICLEEMGNRLKKTSFFVGGLKDEQIYMYFKSKI